MAISAIIGLVVLLHNPTDSVTADLKLLATSKVPLAARIKPYRNALVAQEYLVLKVIKGKALDFKPNTKIRVFRWGVLDEKPTAVGKAKKGDKLRLTVSPLNGWTQMEREFQVDELDGDLSITYYVEVGIPKNK